MLGHKVYQRLLRRFPDTGCTIRGALTEPFYERIDLFREGTVLEGADATDFPTLSGRLRELKPEYVVNCVGVIKQRAEAKAAIPSLAINALLPHQLAELTAEWGGRLIHFSTDCVFSGRRGEYREEDPTDAEDLYGKSKALGEVCTENALTLRTSIIGRELSRFASLLEWFLAQRGREISGYTRVIYSGVTTNYLADLVGDLIEDHPTLSGLYQVTSPPIPKHDLLCLLRAAYDLDVTINEESEVISDRSMVGEKFRLATGYDEPKWPKLVEDLAADPTPYDAWRG
jgi:dTDP-4-dehydrorhamnose reductase